MTQRRVVLFGGLIDDVAMALDEGAAYAVLAGEAHREALVEQGGEGQVLGGRPVDVLARLDAGAAALDDPLDRPVNVNPLGDGGEPESKIDQLLLGDGRVAAPLLAFRQGQ